MSVDKALNKTKAILEQRGQEYGDADLLFNNIADRFSLVLNRPVNKYTTARLLVELKLARLDMGYKQDSLLDALGYLSIAESLHKERL